MVGPAYGAWLAERKARGIEDDRRLDPGAAAGRSDPGELRIVHPHAGDRFVRPPDGDEPLEIRVCALPGRAVTELRWFLDGQEVERTATPYTWTWRATAGRHVVAVADADGARSTAVEVTVE